MHLFLPTLLLLFDLMSASALVPGAFASAAMRSVLVSGATGKQGGAVVDALLAKNKYQVFGISRNPEGQAAQTLKNKGVQVLQADFGDKGSVLAAMQTSGASLFYLVTDFQGAKFNRANEIQQGLNCINAAKECGHINFLVFSSVGGCEDAPEAVDAFKSKLEIETSLRSSGLNFAVLRPHSFLENFNMPGFPLEKGFARGLLAPDVKSYLIACRDIGKAAAAMMDDPDKWHGQTLDCTSCCLSGNEVGEALTRASGEACVYQTSGVARFLKWFGYFGFLNGIRSLIVHLEGGNYRRPDVGRFLEVVPDAFDAEAYFNLVGQWSNGAPFKSKGGP